MKIRDAVKTYNEIIKAPSLYAQLKSNGEGNYLVYEFADQRSYSPDSGEYYTLTGEKRRLTIKRVRELEADEIKARELWAAVQTEEPGSEAYDKALARYENFDYSRSLK